MLLHFLRDHNNSSLEYSPDADFPAGHRVKTRNGFTR
jgi:hypothetical protein